MQSIEGLKRRVAITQDLESVVRTMKALSAASIRQYERAVSALAEYYRTVEMGLQVVLKDQPVTTTRLQGRRAGRTGAIVLGSDQGLCGRFNEIIVSQAMDTMNENHADPADRLVLAIGSRVAARLESSGQPVEESLPVPGSVNGITFTVEEMLLKVDEWQSADGVDEVLVFYNSPRPGRVYYPRVVHLLPVDLSRFRPLEREPWPSRALPTYRMEREQLLSALLKQYFFVTLFHACAGSLASEHASRLSAMQRAAKNIEEHLQELNARYREQRQASITDELLDIVGGYEALVASNPRRSSRSNT